jgi:hypothetical protein
MDAASPPQEIPVLDVPIPGLTFSQLDESVTNAALSEMVAFLDAFGEITGKKKNAREAADIEWSFAAAREGERAKFASLSDYPATAFLITTALVALGEPAELHLDKLNVIVQRYRKGQGCNLHRDCWPPRDLPIMFEEPVYGCVLLNSSPQSLIIQKRKETYRFDERPGIVFGMKGDARYEWHHGIKKLTEGERISLTWRWFVKPGSDSPELRKATSAKERRGITCNQ